MPFGDMGFLFWMRQTERFISSVEVNLEKAYYF